MSLKSKGTKAERDVINLFWENSWAAIRSAGSGSMHFPSPDILAGNKLRRLAVEVKATKDDKKYFPAEEIKQLKNFSDYFGAEPWLAIKFAKTPFIFVNPEDLETTREGNFCFSKENPKGLSFQEAIGNFENTTLQ